MDQSGSKNDAAALPSPDSQKNKPKRKIPSPRELVAQYESRGMDTQEASFKVIEDLQNALFRTMLSNRKDRKSPPGQSPDISRKLDVINGRLLQLDMKVDSKPGYPQMLAIGVTSGAIVGAVAKGASEIWAAIQRTTSTTN
ncbi:OLC1v1025270C1 [Oldenlandia corymbosa var. corymbosa]|uniref:OLC1v1025270C1 n=1 Tax=Oldenlandia corymbosa var. corymbosa TaxID=529605 RepID=A0AAV1C4C3_OLDCO|nr:OLC1v1025270C1 [Oldenlandia corymbosa var. corymbosa]